MGKLWLVGLVCLTHALNVPHIRIDQDSPSDIQGDLVTFGNNQFGQLGLGDRLAHSTSVSPRNDHTLEPDDMVSQIFTGCDSSHAFAVSTKGVLVGWGRNSDGQLGTKPLLFARAPHVISHKDLGRVRMVALSSLRSVALSSRGRVFLLANGEVTPLDVGNQDIISVAAGSKFILLVSKDGSGWVVGRDNKLTQVPGARNIVSAFACGNQAYLLSSDGHILVWGDNSRGQLCVPDVSEISSADPVRVNSQSNYGTVISISPGPLLTLAITDESQILACYSTSAGLRFVPFTDVAYKALSASVGSKHALVALASGEVFGWGSNVDGQLSQLPIMTVDPVKLKFGRSVKKFSAVAAGSDFSVILSDDSCPKSNCVNGVASPADECQCVCQPDWTGVTCALCARAALCVHGTLTEADCGCACFDPWKGENCDVCEDVCVNGKQTIQGHKCECSCKSGWGGDACDKCLLKPTECVHGRLDPETCTCKCVDSWGGEFCDQCQKSKTTCIHGHLDTLTCACVCDTDWTGINCDVCGIAEKATNVCLEVNMWHDGGSAGWDDHALYFVPANEGVPLATLTHKSDDESHSICVPPGVYSVYACGQSSSSALGIGWAVQDISGTSSDDCKANVQHLVVYAGGCNMGSLDSTSCTCQCDGGWQGDPECFPLVLTLASDVAEHWSENIFVIEDKLGRYIRTIEGRTGTQEICLPKDVYAAYGCRRKHFDPSTSAVGSKLYWEIEFNNKKESGTSDAFQFCTEVLHKPQLNVTRLLLPNIGESKLKAFRDLGIEMVTADKSKAQVRGGYCNSCPLIDACEHGAFVGDCSCTCQEPWVGPTCNVCGLTPASLEAQGYVLAHIRIDDKHCVANCAGGWSGEKCDTCGLKREHCEGKINLERCSCEPTDESEPPKQCVRPWTGPDCSICPRNSHFCQNDGTLKECLCDCHLPWIGDDCSVCGIRSNSCEHGTKSEQGCACTCEGGWSGIFCGECHTKCAHGTRNNNCECNCEPGWGDFTCSACILSPSDCGHGSLDADKCSCACDDGWAGEKCDQCALSGCVHGQFDSQNCECKCDKYWEGRLCQACSRQASDCEHGALNSTCECACDDHWAGQECEVCQLGAHSCVHGVFEPELCSCSCPPHRKGTFCEQCDLTPDVCGGSVNVHHCTCGTIPRHPQSLVPDREPDDADPRSRDGKDKQHGQETVHSGDSQDSHDPAPTTAHSDSPQAASPETGKHEHGTGHSGDSTRSDSDSQTRPAPTTTHPDSHQGASSDSDAGKHEHGDDHSGDSSTRSGSNSQTQPTATHPDSHQGETQHDDTNTQHEPEIEGFDYNDQFDEYNETSNKSLGSIDIHEPRYDEQPELPSSISEPQFTPSSYKGLLDFDILVGTVYDSRMGTTGTDKTSTYEIEFTGNTWKAIELGHSYEVTPNTHLEFDLKIDLRCASVAIGLAEKLNDYESEKHILLAYSSAVDETIFVDVTRQVEPPVHHQWQHYNILLGDVYESGSYPYLVFVIPCSGQYSHVSVRRVQIYEGSSQRYLDDGSCGPSTVAPHGGIAECSAIAVALSQTTLTPCCSSQGKCGSASRDCDCDECVDYRPQFAPPPKFAFRTFTGLVSQTTPVDEPISETVTTTYALPPKEKDPELPVPMLTASILQDTSISSTSLHSIGCEGSEDCDTGITDSELFVSGTGTIDSTFRLETPIDLTEGTHVDLDFKAEGSCVDYGVIFRETEGHIIARVALVGSPHSGFDFTMDTYITGDGKNIWRRISLPIGLEVRADAVALLSLFADGCPTHSKFSIANIRVHDARASVDFSNLILAYETTSGTVTANSSRVVDMTGETSSVVPLGAAFVTTRKSRLQFDFKSPAGCALQTIGFTTSVTSKGESFKIAGAADAGKRIDYAAIEPYTKNWKRYDIPLGLFVSPGQTIPFVTFTSSCGPRVVAELANVAFAVQESALPLSLVSLMGYAEDEDYNNPDVEVVNDMLILGRNTWKAIQLPNAVNMVSGTHLSFDLNINKKKCRHYGVAFVRSLAAAEDNLNIHLAGTAGANDEKFWLDYSKVRPYITSWTSYDIPVGLIYPTDVYPYLALIHDCDCVGDTDCGHMSVANIRIYRADTKHS